MAITGKYQLVAIIVIQLQIYQRCYFDETKVDDFTTSCIISFRNVQFPKIKISYENQIHERLIPLTMTRCTAALLLTLTKP